LAAWAADGSRACPLTIHYQFQWIVRGKINRERKARIELNQGLCESSVALYGQRAGGAGAAEEGYDRCMNMRLP
jgi:hypothetical protein